MALCRTGPNPAPETNCLSCSAQNLSTRLVIPVPSRFIGKFSNLGRKRHGRIFCSSLRKAASASSSSSSIGSQEDAPSALTNSMEEDLDHVIQFKMSDFKILDCISVGLGGRV